MIHCRRHNSSKTRQTIDAYFQPIFIYVIFLFSFFPFFFQMPVSNYLPLWRSLWCDSALGRWLIVLTFSSLSSFWWGNFPFCKTERCFHLQNHFIVPVKLHKCSRMNLWFPTKAMGTFKESCFVCLWIAFFSFVFENQLKTFATQILSLFVLVLCFFINWLSNFGADGF